MPASALLPEIPDFGEPITVSIHGTVVDGLGIPLQRVKVRLLEGEAMIAFRHSDENGEFSFLNQQLTVGYYTFRASLPGFSIADEQVLLTKDLDKGSFHLMLRVIGIDLDESESKLWKTGSPSLESLTSPKTGGGGAIRIGNVEDSRGPKTGALEAIEPLRNPTEVQVPKLEKAPRPTDTQASLPTPRYTKLRVLYVTDRQRSLRDTPQGKFLGECSNPETVSFGACEVQLPYARKTGEVPRPSIFRFQIKEDPEKHIIIKSCEDLSERSFYSQLSEKGPSVLLFVHGYSVTFAEAIYRTAQIADDIGFAGAPVCYSWPSVGHFYGYKTDEENVMWTREHLGSVLRQIISLGKIKSIDIIAHSMGSRAVVDVLSSLAEGGVKSLGSVENVVFAAPDVASINFRQALDKMKSVVRCLTLYASDKDKPLLWSSGLSRLDRAGQGGERLILDHTLNSIDASSLNCGVLDHSYFGSTWNVLTDLYDLFTHGTPLPRRSVRGPENRGNGPYWLIRA